MNIQRVTVPLVHHRPDTSQVASEDDSRRVERADRLRASAVAQAQDLLTLSGTGFDEGSGAPGTVKVGAISGYCGPAEAHLDPSSKHVARLDHEYRKGTHMHYERAGSTERVKFSTLEGTTEALFDHARGTLTVLTFE